MKIYKETVEDRKQIIVQSGDNKFIMGFWGADLYWIMPEYTANNKFTVTQDVPYLFNFLKDLFATERFKNNTFIWLSEAYSPENSSSLKITKGKDFYRIKFIRSEGDFLARFMNTCSICFCLSGSRNQRIANNFSIFLNELLTRDF